MAASSSQVFNESNASGSTATDALNSLKEPSSLAIGGNLASGTTFSLVNGKGLATYNPVNNTPSERAFSSLCAPSLTADTANDILALVGEVQYNQNGHHCTAQHVSGVEGQASATGASGTIDFINGSLYTVGNQGAGTVTTAVDVHGHNDLNTGGGTFVNHYFLYQEYSTAAQNEYGAFFTAPIGIGISTPIYNLDMGAGLITNLSAVNWCRFGEGNGTFFMTANGSSIYPGNNHGAGTFGANGLFSDGASIDVTTAGFGLKVAEGSNAKQGVATLSSGTVVVANTSVTANSRIFLTAQSLGTVTAPSALCVSARMAGTSFTILASQNTDTSVIAYEIFEPG